MVATLGRRLLLFITESAASRMRACGSCWRYQRYQAAANDWLFVGSQEGGERTAIILTVVASAHRHDLDVWAYLRDVLERLAKGESNLENLLPDRWKAEHPQHVRDFRADERQERADERRYHRAKRRIELANSTP